MRVLGIDYGHKRLGLAISDPLGFTAQGLETYARRAMEDDLAHLQKVVGEYGVDTIVLGWPRNMNGTEGALCQQVGEFAETLEEAFALRMDYVDERLSSAMAERTLIQADVSRKKRKDVIDKMAAAVILQDYLDSGAYNKRRTLPWKKDIS